MLPMDMGPYRTQIANLELSLTKALDLAADIVKSPELRVNYNHTSLPSPLVREGH